MTSTPAPATPTGLLASWNAHHRADLAAHLDTHGPLPLPARRDDGWAERLAGEIEAAGLTGRGGAAFPTARKLAAVRRAGRGATIVVNAMEGEPASDKDRVLFSVAPHLVLDGAQLAAHAIGAARIVICIAADCDDTADRVLRAIGQRASSAMGQRASSAMGQRASSATGSVPVEVARPPARYVAGEESALVSWLDGGPSAPTFRPDKSIPLSIGRRPTLVHNAETLAHVALIARHGAPWFRRCGLNDAPGTTLVTVSGAVEHPGVHEIALGTPIGEIVARSVPVDGVAAVLVGGYGGTWLGESDLDTPYAPGPLAHHGAGVGAGILIVLGTRQCGLAGSAAIARYMAGESAGQCGPCVFGLPALADDLHALAAGRGAPETVARLHARFGAIEGRGACRHPDGVVRMIRSALRVFADDVAAHAARRPCRTGAGPVVMGALEHGGARP
jgi:NADH:ubiquinone oxidoreductase subunit F (NADH-binding)